MGTDGFFAASRADKPSAVVVPQLVALPFTFAIVSLFGILIGSSSVVIFDEFVWSPNEVSSALVVKGSRGELTRRSQIMARFLQDSPSAGDRAGVFFISAAFILCVYVYTNPNTQLTPSSTAPSSARTSLPTRFPPVAI